MYLEASADSIVNTASSVRTRCFILVKAENYRECIYNLDRFSFLPAWCPFRRQPYDSHGLVVKRWINFTKAEIDSTSYLVGVNFGSFIKSNGFTQIEIDLNEFRAC